MSEFNGFYYDHQFRRYIVQFMAIFADMQVQVGWLNDTEPRLIKVPVKNSSSTRIVADLISENTQNKPIRLPLMSASLRGLTLAPERRHAPQAVNRTVYTPTGGLAPNDTKVVRQRMPVPYIAQFELSIWASNQNEHYQILEQILSIFNPILEIQTSDDVLDWTRITSVELVGIAPEEDAAGTERRLIRTTLSFDVVIYLSLPAIIRDNIIRNIFVRIGAVNAVSQTSQDFVADLDAQGIEYEPIFQSADFNLPEE